MRIAMFIVVALAAIAQRLPGEDAQTPLPDQVGNFVDPYAHKGNYYHLIKTTLNFRPLPTPGVGRVLPLEPHTLSKQADANQWLPLHPYAK
jgi:hypothetical protein